MKNNDQHQSTLPEVVITGVGGNCPVQGYGTVNGKPFYFRARGEDWSMCVGDSSGDLILEPDWYFEQPYGDEPFSAGWMTETEARAFIQQAAERYMLERQNAE